MVHSGDSPSCRGNFVTFCRSTLCLVQSLSTQSVEWFEVAVNAVNQEECSVSLC